MAAEWFCEIDGRQLGPVTPGQLKLLAVAGKLLPTHPVWKHGMQKKVQARIVQGLFDEETPARPPLPPLPRRKEAGFDVLEEVEEAAEIELEVIGQRPAKKQPEPEEEEEPEVLAETEVTYRDGHPDSDGPLVGVLCVQTDGLRFLVEDEEEFFIPFKKVETLMEPAKGDFPDALKRKALGAKLGGKAAGMAAGLMGSLIGDTAGKIVEGVGKAASKSVEQTGELGKPPRNRIVVVARLRKERHKVRFDTVGKDRDEMNEEARHLFKKMQKALNGYADPAAEPEVVHDVNIVVEDAREPREEKSPDRRTAAPFSPGGGKPFRIMAGGAVRGPFSLEEIRLLAGSGKLADDVLIGVETWLPLGTLRGLIGGAGGKAGTKEEADYEEVEEEEDETPADDGGDIPVDDEFQLD